ncbi:MAG: hypothetical protein KA100_01755 [Rickettsiales bacterium]|nr:hypothetical protein [Rickettsiales bacterium]
MASYKWITLTSGDDSEKKPLLALIAPANGFYGSLGQQKIKDRLELLTKLGFEVKIPVFSCDFDGSDIASIQEKINFDIAEQKAALGSMQVVIEPNLEGRMEPEFPVLAPLANSPLTGARLVIDCVQNGWNMMPLAGGTGLQEKVPHVRQYFASHPDLKNPTVTMFGYSNITWSNSLMLDGICSYCPTQFINNFTKIEEIKAKIDPSLGEIEWLAYLESQAEKLKLALVNPANIDTADRKVLFFPSSANEVVEKSMHYPLNVDVFTGPESDPNLFMPNPDEKWSFAIEWMMQRGDNPSIFSNAVELLDGFLARNAAHPPEFIEMGILGTRLDGLNGLWDLIYDEDGNITSDANVDIILFKDSTKRGFVEKLNHFLREYKSCSAEDRSLHGDLPSFLRDKLDCDLNKISKVDVETISREEIKDIFKWRNEVFSRVTQKVVEVAAKHNLPLVFNSSYGHVANMSPNISGPCEYKFDELGLSLRKLEDRSLTANPRSFIKSASAEEFQKASAELASHK